MPPALLAQSEDVSSLEQALGYRFARPELLIHALTHRSQAYEVAVEANENGADAVRGDNERLEFLGDAVLGLVVAEGLYSSHPEWQEGELTRLRAQLVSRRNLADVATAVGLGRHLRLGKGEERSGGRRKAAILANAMEAVIAAMFLDADAKGLGGLTPVRGFVQRSILGSAADALARELVSGASLGDHKSALQEHLQATRAGVPVYVVESESGPDHRKRFQVVLHLKSADGQVREALARGAGSTKKRAEQEAARRALSLLAGEAAGGGTGTGMSGLPMVPMQAERTAVAEGGTASGVVRPESAEAGVQAVRNHHPGNEKVHGIPEAISSLLQTIVVVLFVLTFLAQPMVIPSESMEHTLLVGDFLLMNRSALAPAGIWRRILPDSSVERGEIVTFRSPLHPKEYLIKRVIGLPGDRLRIDNGKVRVNGQLLDEPYAAFEPTTANAYLDHFPTAVYSDPGVEPGWWKQLQQDTHNGELVIPAGEYFMLGDNRNNSRDSRYWGFVARDQIVARPLVIYFSLTRPSRTDVQQASDDRLGHESDLSAQWKGFARWKRIFHVVH